MRPTIMLWTLVVPYATYNNFVDGSRPVRDLYNLLNGSCLSTRFELSGLTTRLNVKRVEASGIKATMASQEKRGPLLMKTNRRKVVVV